MDSLIDELLERSIDDAPVLADDLNLGYLTVPLAQRINDQLPQAFSSLIIVLTERSVFACIPGSLPLECLDRKVKLVQLVFEAFFVVDIADARLLLSKEAALAQTFITVEDSAVFL